jgi:hypothetical protein
MRLTKEVRAQLLAQNEGFEARTHFDSKNSSWTRRYRIEGGPLRFRETGKTSWADRRYDNEYIADDDETHRFLRKHVYELNTEGLE